MDTADFSPVGRNMPSGPRHRSSIETIFPPAPTEYQTGWHAFQLRKVEVQPDPGVGRTGSRLRLVLDVHHIDDAGQPIYLIDRFDVFEPITGDLATASGAFLTLLQHLGLDPG